MKVGPEEVKELERSLGIVTENLKNKSPYDPSLIKSIRDKDDPKSIEAKSLVRKMNEEKKIREAKKETYLKKLTIKAELEAEKFLK